MHVELLRATHKVGSTSNDTRIVRAVVNQVKEFRGIAFVDHGRWTWGCAAGGSGGTNNVGAGRNQVGQLKRLRNTRTDQGGEDLVARGTWLFTTAVQVYTIDRWAAGIGQTDTLLVVGALSCSFIGWKSNIVQGLIVETTIEKDSRSSRATITGQVITLWVRITTGKRAVAAVEKDIVDRRAALTREVGLETTRVGQARTFVGIATEQVKTVLRGTAVSFQVGAFFNGGTRVGCIRHLTCVDGGKHQSPQQHQAFGRETMIS